MACLPEFARNICTKYGRLESFQACWRLGRFEPGGGVWAVSSPVEAFGPFQPGGGVWFVRTLKGRFGPFGVEFGGRLGVQPVCRHLEHWSRLEHSFFCF